MNNSAKYTDKPDINHSFVPPKGLTDQIFVKNLCSQTLKKREVGKIINSRSWMLECYSDFAGDLYLLNPRVKKKNTREKHSMHLYAPGCMFREDTRNANLPLRESFVHFYNGEVYGMDILIDKNLKFCSFLDSEERVIKVMLEAAQAVSLNGDKAFWQVQSLFLKCVDYLVNSSVKTGEYTYEVREEAVSPERELVRRAEDFMRENISSNIKNSDIAEFLNMSESSFSHKFKKAAGIPPNSRLIEMRIDAAKNLLIKGVKLMNISEAVGLRDEFHLSRIFKEKTGLSPRDFRDGRG